MQSSDSANSTKHESGTRPLRALNPFRHELLLGFLLVAGLLFARQTQPRFATLETQLELSTHIWEPALLALPMTLIIITGGIDLSVGSAIALSAVALGLSFEAGANIWLASALAILTGAAAGLLNGLFVAYVRVHPLIVTLATLSAYRGIAEGVSLGRPISGFPDAFAFIGQGTLLGLPLPGMVFAICAIAAAFVLARTPTGRSIYAIGHNETTCRLSGIPVQRIKLMLYTLSGLAAGLAAVMLVSRRNTAKADLGTQMELDVITAVVLGGTSIYGGRGRIIGTVLGLLLIHETREYVSWRWNRDELILVVIGGLLIASVLVNRLISRR